MKIFFEVGNSRCKYATEVNGSLSTMQYIVTSALTERWLSDVFTGVTDCYLADVANSQTRYVLNSWCKKNAINFQQLVSAAKSKGVRCAYKKAEQFGVDRWLTLLAAHRLFPAQDSLIIDAGTATTVDFIDSTGQHHGGWILAGIGTCVSALLDNTANVRAQTKSVKTLSFADNTSDAVNQGAWAATIGFVKQAQYLVINNYKVAPDDLAVIFTGGNGKILHQQLALNSTFIDNLVIIGMQEQIA